MVQTSDILFINRNQVQTKKVFLTVYLYTKHTFCLNYKLKKTVEKFLKIILKRFIKIFIKILFDKFNNFWYCDTQSLNIGEF